MIFNHHLGFGQLMGKYKVCLPMQFTMTNYNFMKSLAKITLGFLLGLLLTTVTDVYSQSEAKLAASPNNMWDILINAPVAKQVWGVECNGTNLFATFPYDSNFAFGRYTLAGTLIENFNIAGVPIYSASNPFSLRDMCYDGMYWYAISYAYPNAKVYKLDLSNKTLISSFSLPFSNGYHITFDADLDAGNGGFWCGDYNKVYAVSQSGTTLSGPYILPSSEYGCATDQYSNPGTKFLWFSGSNGSVLRQFNPVTHTFTGLTHSINDLVSSSVVSPISYGLSESKLFFPGKSVLLGTGNYISGSPGYHFFGYELGNTVGWPIDVGVVSILSPNSGNNLGTAEIVQAVIGNYGTSTVSNIPVKYSVNGVSSPTNIITVSLMPGAQITWTLSPPADLQIFNNYQICVTTMLTGDGNPANDGICKTVVNNPQVLTTIFPQMAANWTGTVEGPASATPYIISQNSLINYASGEARAGWAKFPLATIPPGVQIVDVKLHWWLQSQTGAPMLSLKKLSIDPILSTPTNLYNDIKNGFSYTGNSNSWNTAASWQSSNLQNYGNVLTDIFNAASVGTGSWFGIGFYEPDTCFSCNYKGFGEGWNQTHKPYLEVTYQALLAHDVGVVEIISPAFAVAGSPIIPQAKVRNFGSTNELFSVTMAASNGYSSTKTLYRQALSGDTVISFDTLIVSATGSINFNCCAVLAPDINYLNQCKGKSMTISTSLTQAYGYINQSLTPGLQKGPVSFYLEYPDVITQIAVNTSNDPLVCGSWGKSPTIGSAWYAAEVYNPPLYNSGHLVKIDPITGTYTSIGPLGVSIDGMTYDYVNGKLFGINSTMTSTGKYKLTLYEINRTTGQAVLFANLGNTEGKITNLASNANGLLFFTDTKEGQLYSIDPQMYTKAKVGSPSQSFKQNADMEFDRASGKLYYCAMDTSWIGGALFKMNPANGQTSLLNYFPSGVMITGFAIPYTPVNSPTDLGLMTMSFPQTGTLTNSEAVVVRVVNYGSTTVSNFKLSFKLNSVLIETDQWATFGNPPLAPGDWMDYSFNNLIDLSAPGATFCLQAYVWDVPGDVNQANDTVNKCVTNTACAIANLCFPGSQAESELCGANLNGGCNSIPVAYVSLNPGDAWCGTVWKVDTLFDQDWYSFTLSTTKTVHFLARTAFNLDMKLFSLPCGGNIPIKSKSVGQCQEDSLVFDSLPPGTYALRISPDFNATDILCGFSDGYSLKYKQIPLQPTIVTSLGSLNGFCKGVYDIPILVDSCYYIQQIHLNIEVPAGIILIGVGNLNPALDPAGFNISVIGTHYVITWFSMNQVSLGSGLLLNLVLDIPAGTSNLNWGTGPDSSYYGNGTIGTIPASWVNGTINLLNCNDLSGNVYYAHKSGTGISIPKLMGNFVNTCDSVQVQLWAGSTLIDTACTGYNGNYQFTSLPNGSYTLKAKINKRWGGVNSVDAQLIQMNLVHLNGFYMAEPWLSAGDVNGIGSIPNALDGLIMMRRFVGIIPNFLPPGVVPGKPDYYSESFNLSFNGAVNQTQDIRVLCTGDVNGSYSSSPPPKNLTNFNTDRILIAGNGVMEVPVYSTQSMEMGSISLVMNYPTNLEIKDISIKQSPENLVYLAQNGQLRLAWYGIVPINLKSGDILFTMKVNVHALDYPAIFSNTIETELSDGMGDLIENAELAIPKILPAILGGEITLENIPNPFNETTEIRYSLPTTGKISIKVYNLLGEEVSILFEGIASAKSHSLKFDGSGMRNGIYFCKLMTDSGCKVKTMVISRSK